MKRIWQLRHAYLLSRFPEIINANKSLAALIESLEEDIKITRRIQKTLIPEKFRQPQGLKVTHKYLAGIKSGGDYLDFFEFDDKTHVGILMSDSSGYGLSSAFLSVILRLAMKLSKNETRSPSQTVMKIFEELQLTMKPKENLSVFYGILNLKTFELTYTSTGSIRLFHDNDEHEVKAAPLMKGQEPSLSDQQMYINPGERLVIVSDGFSSLFNKPQAFVDLLKRLHEEDAIALINELTFGIKKKFESEEDMPEQDCSVMVIDVEKRAMRLAR
jgi:sigma-B regulation protein RsbU (phosphoserine phosphatase)